MIPTFLGGLGEMRIDFSYGTLAMIDSLFNIDLTDNVILGKSFFIND